MSIDFDSKNTYGDDDKYIKTKIKSIKTTSLQIFIIKNTRRKNTTQMFIDNNSRFCSLSIWKVLSANIFRRM